MFTCNFCMFMHQGVNGRKVFLSVCAKLDSMQSTAHNVYYLVYLCMSATYVHYLWMWFLHSLFCEIVAPVPKPSNLAAEVMTVGWLHGMVCWVRGCGGSLDLSVYYLPLLLSLWLALASVPCMIQSVLSLQSCLAVVLQLSI